MLETLDDPTLKSRARSRARWSPSLMPAKFAKIRTMLGDFYTQQVANCRHRIAQQDRSRERREHWTTCRSQAFALLNPDASIVFTEQCDVEPAMVLEGASNRWGDTGALGHCDHHGHDHDHEHDHPTPADSFVLDAGGDWRREGHRTVFSRELPDRRLAGQGVHAHRRRAVPWCSTPWGSWRSLPCEPRPNVHLVFIGRLLMDKRPHRQPRWPAPVASRGSRTRHDAPWPSSASWKSPSPDPWLRRPTSNWCARSSAWSCRRARFIADKSLMAELEIGRTPIREAMQRLAVEGLLHHLPNRGMFVSEISATGVQQIYEFRSHHRRFRRAPRRHSRVQRMTSRTSRACTRRSCRPPRTTTWIEYVALDRAFYRVLGASGHEHLPGGGHSPHLQPPLATLVLHRPENGQAGTPSPTAHEVMTKDVADAVRHGDPDAAELRHEGLHLPPAPGHPRQHVARCETVSRVHQRDTHHHPHGIPRERQDDACSAIFSGDEGMADTAVLINEFGEIGLDHLLVQEIKEGVVLLNSGLPVLHGQGGAGGQPSRALPQSHPGRGAEFQSRR